MACNEWYSLCLLLHFPALPFWWNPDKFQSALRACCKAYRFLADSRTARET